MWDPSQYHNLYCKLNKIEKILNFEEVRDFKKKNFKNRNVIRTIKSLKQNLLAYFYGNYDATMLGGLKNHDSNGSKHSKQRRFNTFELQKFGSPNIFYSDGWRAELPRYHFNSIVSFF